jgi:type II secretion system protein J
MHPGECADARDNDGRTLKITTHKVRAFTLIEMILAVGVSAVVLVVATATFFTALHLRNATQAMVDAEAPLDQTTAILRRDLQCLMVPKTNGIFSGDFKVGDVTSAGVNQTVAIEMYTATGALSETAPWGDVQKVTYELRTPTGGGLYGKDLIRSVSRNILATGTMDVDNQWMMGGVDSLHITCYDGQQWQSVWDTTDLTSATTNLPVAVKVEIGLAGDNNGGVRPSPIQILVPIDSQSLTNS